MTTAFKNLSVGQLFIFEHEGLQAFSPKRDGLKFLMVFEKMGDKEYRGRKILRDFRKNKTYSFGKTTGYTSLETFVVPYNESEDTWKNLGSRFSKLRDQISELGFLRSARY